LLYGELKERPPVIPRRGMEVKSEK